MKNEKTLKTLTPTLTIKTFEAKDGKTYKALFCGDKLVTFDRLIIWRLANGGGQK